MFTVDIFVYHRNVNNDLLDFRSAFLAKRLIGLGLIIFNKTNPDSDFWLLNLMSLDSLSCTRVHPLIHVHSPNPDSYKRLSPNCMASGFNIYSQLLISARNIWKNVGPIRHCEPPHVACCNFTLPFTRCRYCRHHDQDEPKPAIAITQAACDNSDTW